MTGWFHQRFLAAPKMRSKPKSQCGNTFIPCAPEHEPPPRHTSFLFLEEHKCWERNSFWGSGGEMSMSWHCTSARASKRKDSARERHWSRARLLLYWPSVPCREILIFFCQQALTKISLSIWPIMKEVSKTSVSRHECSIFFSGEKPPSSLLRVCTRCAQGRGAAKHSAVLKDIQMWHLKLV